MNHRLQARTSGGSGGFRRRERSLQVRWRRDGGARLRRGSTLRHHHQYGVGLRSRGSGVPTGVSATPNRPDDATQGAMPAVSIILPTYNRAHFLAKAFESIGSQTFPDWELIVVDDGSTDGTRELATELLSGLPQSSRYIFQNNQGAYGARNTGLEQARGKYVAFFDSDDQWLPHHLQRCAEALDANPDVDWVYGASRIVDCQTGELRSADSFQVDGQPRPFRKLRCEVRGGLRVLDAPGLVRHILLGAGLYAGLQNSVIRRSAMSGLQFCTSFYNEAEDQAFLIRFLARGSRIGYFDVVHHVYCLHDQNSSASAIGLSPSRREAIYRGVVRGFEALGEQIPLSRSERWALRRKLSNEYFWRLGFSTLWQHGQYRAALGAYGKAIRLYPFDISCWKTLMIALLRVTVLFRLSLSGGRPKASA